MKNTKRNGGCLIFVKNHTIPVHGPQHWHEMQFLIFGRAVNSFSYPGRRLNFIPGSNPIVMKNSIIVILVLAAFGLQAQTKSNHDPIFPAPRHFNGGIITTFSSLTPPPVFIGDITYGISKKLALGITGGTTGALALYGMKVNVGIVEREQFRLYFRSMIVYYPKRNGVFLFDRTEKKVMPWMLSMGVLDAEWRTRNGLRYTVGMGLMEDHCLDQLKIWLSMLDGDEDALFESYYTLQSSMAIPIGKRLTVRPEVIAVFQDFQLIEKAQHKIVFPVNAYINLVYSF